MDCGPGKGSTLEFRVRYGGGMAPEITGLLEWDPGTPVLVSALFALDFLQFGCFVNGLGS